MLPEARAPAWPGGGAGWGVRRCLCPWAQRRQHLLRPSALPLGPQLPRARATPVPWGPWAHPPPHPSGPGCALCGPEHAGPLAVCVDAASGRRGGPRGVRAGRDLPEAEQEPEAARLGTRRLGPWGAPGLLPRRRRMPPSLSLYREKINEPWQSLEERRALAPGTHGEQCSGFPSTCFLVFQCVCSRFDSVSQGETNNKHYRTFPLGDSPRMTPAPGILPFQETLPASLTRWSAAGSRCPRVQARAARVLGPGVGVGRVLRTPLGLTGEERWTCLRSLNPDPKQS